MIRPNVFHGTYSMTCANSVLPTFMRHPRLFKPESIANVQIEIQIVDTHETLETPVVIGSMAKSVLDSGWSTFRTMLQYKCDDAGVWFKEVNESYSTQGVLRLSGAIGSQRAG